MIKLPVRNLHSGKEQPPRVFDVIVDGDFVALEVKNGKHDYIVIPWQDVVYQVEAAKVACQ